jgi:ABC-2 type transport system ATP-binding protein
MASAVSCIEISKSFGKLDALKNVTFDIEKGQVFSIIGRNGAGKSTLMKIMTSQLKQSKGVCKVLGVNTLRNEVKVREISGIIPEQESPSSFLTPLEYLEFCLDMRGIKDKREIEFWLDFLEFGGDKDVLIKDISRGTRQKVMVAQAFVHRPKIVFIDEPLVNLDPFIQKKVKDFIKGYVKKGNTVVISTHLLSLAQELSDTVMVLKRGEVLGVESYNKIKKKHKKLEKYFLKMVGNG